MEAYQETLWGQPEKINIQQPRLPINDPRPDLKYDSKEWTRFLSMANEIDEILYATLHGFRCGGLRIHKEKVGYILRPDLDPRYSAWENQKEYEKDRDKWLLGYGKEIVALLNRLGELEDLDFSEQIKRLGFQEVKIIT